MPIQNRNLQVGTKLVGKYHKQAYKCEVVTGEGGKLRYRLEDGREFKSPSAAGMAITGHACDGWVFWSVETAEQPQQRNPAEVDGMGPQPVGHHFEVCDEKGKPLPPEAVATNEESARKKRPFFRLPNQKGAPAGQTRWYCKDCGKSFLAAVGEIPDSCPEGHKAA